MKLFTVGPVQMYPRTLAVASEQLPYFRDDEFSSMMLQMQEELHTLLHLQHGKSAFITGSGTSAMESLVSCAFDQNDRVLIINGGSFGQRFVELCSIYHIPYDEYRISFPESFDETKLAAFDGSRYTALLVNLHETSVGQLYPIDRIASYAKQHQLYLVVDAISTFLADAYDMDAYHIDATILSSQKALACAPGISMVSMQDHFYENMVEPKQPCNMYLSIKEHINNMKRGQTPNTPAVGVLLEMADMLHELTTMGVEKKIADTKAKADYFRVKLASLPITLPTFPLSNALTPILLQDHDAKEVYRQLKEKGFVVTPSGGSLANQLLRIGHLGNIGFDDYDALLKELKEILQ